MMEEEKKDVRGGEASEGAPRLEHVLQGAGEAVREKGAPPPGGHEGDRKTPCGRGEACERAARAPERDVGAARGEGGVGDALGREQELHPEAGVAAEAPGGGEGGEPPGQGARERDGAAAPREGGGAGARAPARAGGGAGPH